MEKSLGKFKKSTKVLIFTLSWWVLSILAFGDFSTPVKWILLPISTISICFLVNFRWRSDRDHKIFGPNFWYIFLSSFLLSLFGLNIFTISIRETIISLTLDTSFGVIGWWVIMLVFIPGAGIYRRLKRKELSEEFDDDSVAYKRHIKIDKITGNWWY